MFHPCPHSLAVLVLCPGFPSNCCTMSEQPPTKKFKGETVILKSADIVELVKKEVMDDVKAIKDAGGPQPCLAVVLVGERPDSQTYVRHKKKLCGEHAG
eukprot:g57161.t1